MEGNSEVSAAALRTIGVVWIITSLDYAVVVLVLFTLVEEGALLIRIEHDGVPCFPSGASNQGQEGRAKRLEVDMLIHL